MDRRKLILTALKHSSVFAGSGLCLSCMSSLVRQQPSSRLSDSQDLLEDFASAPGGEPLNKQDLLSEEEEARLYHHKSHLSRSGNSDDISKYEQYRMKYFDRHHPGDLFVPEDKRATLHSLFDKLTAIRAYIGYGHFNLLGFDQMLQIGQSALGRRQFSRAELNFFEEIFYSDAKTYGFYGKKINQNMTETISSGKIVKIAGSGHYLHREYSLPIYEKIIRDVGQSLILTSGLRGVVKQMRLFLGKTLSVEYNLSQASRSLAPPGHSYHAIGDFDIGKKGLGSFNFTDKFSQTDEYKKLTDLGYIDIRYPTNNPFGVRFEPWHIEGAGHG
ncbi:MAG: D-alanyl-D-alanine carboxypeptidase family protein [Deltaproteobacteria bacterium]|nr:D-alanyl-D-alanine carboxypeptidase family protein [Deltaproteobacteria bacterium]